MEARLKARREKGCGQESLVPPAASPQAGSGQKRRVRSGRLAGGERFKDEAFWGFTAKPSATQHGEREGKFEGRRARRLQQEEAMGWVQVAQGAP